MSDPSATRATQILSELTAGVDFSLPAVDLSGAIYQVPDPGSLSVSPSHLTNADLTTGVIDGTGSFDVLLKGVKAHLTEEFDKGRITGDQYAKFHAELVAGAMQNAVAFLLGRDAAYWQAVTAQQQALAAQAAVVIARIQLESEKVKLRALNYEMLTNKATYALTELKLATEAVTYDTAKYTLEQMLPSQKALVDAQKADADSQTAVNNYQLSDILPTQKKVLSEQAEQTRAQTLDVRSDGSAVIGLIGKQKDLYAQQITSYQRDAEVKAAKIFTDAWITMKTIDEGLLPSDRTSQTPVSMRSSASLKTKNAIG
jgi:hypothetical protein